MSEIIENFKYSYNDLTIMPATYSKVPSRKIVDPYYHNTEELYRTLPIFTAPMSSVVNIGNLDMWTANHIIPIIPRNIDFDTRINNMIEGGHWIAVGLQELETIYNTYEKFDKPVYILCDIANGHLYNMFELCSKLKAKFKDNIHLMAGNIANPETLQLYESAGIEYVRIGIGGGSVCITSSNTGCHVPMGSLIHECYKKKVDSKLSIKLIADGGIRNYDDVIKALALGADYVMIGGIFGSFFESAAEITTSDELLKNDVYITTLIDSAYNTVYNIEVPFSIDNFKSASINLSNGNRMYTNVLMKDLTEDTKRILIKKLSPKKCIYGMASKRAQSELNTKEGQTAEGIEKYIDCKYTMKQWCDNMKAYMRSIMTYCNAQNLNEFIGKQNLVVNSLAEQKATNI